MCVLFVFVCGSERLRVTRASSPNPAPWLFILHVYLKMFMFVVCSLSSPPGERPFVGTAKMGFSSLVPFLWLLLLCFGCLLLLVLVFTVLFPLLLSSLLVYHSVFFIIVVVAFCIWFVYFCLLLLLLFVVWCLLVFVAVSLFVYFGFSSKCFTFVGYFLGEIHLIANKPTFCKGQEWCAAKQL